MRRRMVSLWDVADDQEVGLGYVEYDESSTQVCAHKWVLDRGYRFRASGLSYRPGDDEVSLKDAEQRLSDRWRSDSRLVVCSAVRPEMPRETSGANLEKLGDGFKGGERIELRGVWEAEISETITGYVLVPSVSWYTLTEALADPTAVSSSLLAGRSDTLRRQNKYVEHWVFQNQPFALSSAQVDVAAPAGAAPSLETFFEDMALRLQAGSSYTLVSCETWINGGA